MSRLLFVCLFVLTTNSIAKTFPITYQYDGVNQLIQERHPSFNISYRYDELGNRVDTKKNKGRRQGRQRLYHIQNNYNSATSQLVNRNQETFEYDQTGQQILHSLIDNSKDKVHHYGVSMQKNILEAQKMTPFEFYDAVKNGGKWDYKQQAGTSLPSWGHWWDLPGSSFGDDPIDQQWIDEGKKDFNGKYYDDIKENQCF